MTEPAALAPLTTTADAAWERACQPRERREYSLVLIVGCTVYPAYLAFDVLLEPAHAVVFATMRAIGTLMFLVALIGVRRTRSLAVARRWFVLGIGLSGPMIASMLPRVDHYTTYFVNYSGFLWACMLLSWPLRHTLRIQGWQLLCVAISFAVHPGTLTVYDILGASFFLATAAVLTTATTYARRTALRQAFDVSQQLAQRNVELESTMARLHETQAKLVAQEKLSALGRMLAGLSHEINNPVNVIKNNLDPVREHLTEIIACVRLALSGAPEDLAALRVAWEAHEIEWRVTDADDAIDSMHAAVAHLRQVHADLRAFIRGDAPEMIAVDVNEGLRATAALVSRRLPKDIVVELELESSAKISCQPGQLNQVWLNLIQNAVDAVGTAGVVTVRSRDRDSHLEVSVTDTGPGVATTFRARLFEPFATTKSPSTGAGTGLGLATSYQIVQRHGGRLYLDEAHATGARFAVELPR